MSNIINIQPIPTFTQNGVVNITSIVFYNYSGYNFIDYGGQVAFRYFDENNNFVMMDSCEIPYELVQEWGSSDQVIYNYVITQKGLITV